MTISNAAGAPLALAALLLFAQPGASFAQDPILDPIPDPIPGAADAPEAPFEGLEFRSLGPAFMSGRIADIAVHPTKRSTWYVAVGSGGVWKTTNRGTTWTPIFEDQPSYSIGCVALDPSNPETVWVGTGENVSGRHVGFGDGLYVSRDGGSTWEARGLEASERIGSIVVHPEDSNVIWVAAQGPLWSGGGERGVYKTTDGGDTWERVLGAGEYTGAGEVIMDRKNPDVLYAAMHQRQRSVAALMNGGPESGIHRTSDGGATWTKLAGGLPSGNVGKIGLAVSHFDSSVVYATIEEANRKGGFWRSTDAGASWEKRSDYLSGGTGPHYYQEIFASPHVEGRVYQMDVRLHVTDDGGKTFHRLKHAAKHSDNHALCFDPRDPEYLLAGCDGGIYESFDHGETWRFAANLPVTQFYKVALDDAEPFYNVYGGTQDNNTQGGPSRTLNAHGITNADWFVTLFGDGHQPATEPGNPNIVYSEWQQGNLVRYDRSTGEIVYVKPMPGADEPEERFNWDAPILVSPHNPARLYFASHRVWRSEDRGDTWTPISGDLTHAIDRFKQPLMGRTWSDDAPWDTYAMSRFSTITSLSESPVKEGVIWAGTDDGRVQMTRDGGGTWTAIDALGDAPDGFFVNDIKADRFDASTAYVVVDNHKQGDFRPFVMKTMDGGQSWSNVASGLPDRHLCWRIVQDHVDPGLLFLGTEFGVFFTADACASWHPLGGGIPTIPVRDLAIHPRENDLVCATFGRGFYVLDDYTPLRGIDESRLTSEAVLFPVREAKWYIPRRPLGAAAALGKGSQGDSYYVASNPPFGAVFTYHLGEGYLSMAEARREAEKNAAGVVSPSVDELRAEENEFPPAVLLRVRDGNGQVVRTIEGPAAKGFHRVAWNLRRPPVDAWQRSAEEDEWSDGSDDGALVAPGAYTVEMIVRVGGVETSRGVMENFQVTPLGQGALPSATPESVALFQSELADANRLASSSAARAGELLEKSQAIQSVLARTPGAGPELLAAVRDLELRLGAIQRRLGGDPKLSVMNEAGSVPVSARLSHAGLGVRYSTYGPTPSHRESLAIAAAALQDIDRDLNQIREAELLRLNAALDELGAPWTPGR